jgi:hypothetical protein
MEVQISKVSYETINLSDDQVEKIVLAYLKKALLPGEWIDASNNVKGDENHRHGSISEINYGPANATQMAAWEMVKQIQENKRQRAKLADVAMRCRQKD